MHDELFARNGLSLDRLRTFAEIVSAGGPTRAAKGDSTRQSQYSRQLKELEEFFGTELYARRGGKWILTAPGASLRRLINEHLGALVELRTRCAGAPVALRIGAGESFLQWRLIPQLAKLRRELPDVRFVLLNRRSEDVAAGLVSGELEFGVLPADETPASLKSVALQPIGYRLFVPRALHVDGDRQTPARLLSLPLVLLEGGGATQEMLSAEAVRHGQKLNVVLECSSHLQAANIVRQGLAAAVLPTEASAVFAAHEVEAHILPCLRKTSRRVALAWNAHVIRARPALAVATRALIDVLK